LSDKKILSRGLVAIESDDLERVIIFASKGQNCKIAIQTFYSCNPWEQHVKDNEEEAYKDYCNEKCPIRIAFRALGYKYVECPDEEEWAAICVSRGEQWHEDMVASLIEREINE
jgi:hypothetical protein